MRRRWEVIAVLEYDAAGNRIDVTWETHLRFWRFNSAMHCAARFEGTQPKLFPVPLVYKVRRVVP